MVTNHFYPSSGGMERQAQRLAAQLNSSGHSVEILTPRYGNLAKYELVEGIPITRFPILRSPHVRKDFFSKLKYTLTLIAHIWAKRRQTDILHVHQALFAAFVTVIAAKLMRKRVLIKVAGSGAYGNMAAFDTLFRYSKIMLRIMRKADVFISISPEITAELLEKDILREKITEIPNGISTLEYNVKKSKYELRELSGIDNDNFLCVFAGRLSPEKNIRFLLNAWKEVSDKKNNCLLLLAGDGPERESLEELSQQLGIMCKTKFMGHIDNVAELLACCDCFVLPSSSGEGMSNSILEAMTVGIPCVVSNIPANCNLIKNNFNGLTFDLTDYKNLSSAILRLQSDPELSVTLSDAARKNVHNCYRIESVADRYVEVYCKMLGIQYECSSCK